jgi:N6-adenosine-specific RNA methylase IME4
MIYHTIVADPPWQYRNKLDMSDGVERSAMSQYSTMTLPDIQNFLTFSLVTTILREGYPVSPYYEDRWTDARIADVIAPDAHLWLWVTNPFLIDGSGAAVAKAWGFEPKALCTWVKGRLTIVELEDGTFKPSFKHHLGMGRYVRGCTEHMLFCVRGKGQTLVQDKGVPNYFFAKRTEHSAKPDEAFALVRRVSPGPYLSIFERTWREGFDAIGNELPEAV